MRTLIVALVSGVVAAITACSCAPSYNLQMRRYMAQNDSLITIVQGVLDTDSMIRADQRSVAKLNLRLASIVSEHEMEIRNLQVEIVILNQQVHRIQDTLTIHGTMQSYPDNWDPDYPRGNGIWMPPGRNKAQRQHVPLIQQ